MWDTVRLVPGHLKGLIAAHCYSRSWFNTLELEGNGDAKLKVTRQTSGRNTRGAKEDVLFL